MKENVSTVTYQKLTIERSDSDPYSKLQTSKKGDQTENNKSVSEENEPDITSRSTISSIKANNTEVTVIAENKILAYNKDIKKEMKLFLEFYLEHKYYLCSCECMSKSTGFSQK